MSRESGFSVIELLVASAILLTISGAMFGLLQDGLAGTPVIEESTDLHQRTRVAVDAITSELRIAAAGTASGPLSRYFAGIDPRRAADPPGSAFPHVITLRYVPSRGASGRLAQPLAAGIPVAIVDGAGCPAKTTACGFAAGTMAVIFDTSGRADFVSIDATGPGALTISDPFGPRGSAYPAGAEIAEAMQVTYAFDAAARQLRRGEGTVSFVLVDNVSSLEFEYFDRGMTRIPLEQFADGPFAGAGATMFDVDLLRVASVRATLRLETGVDRMRGKDSRLFARPGTATGRRTIPDLVARVDVALRNGPE